MRLHAHALKVSGEQHQVLARNGASVLTLSMRRRLGLASATVYAQRKCANAKVVFLQLAVHAMYMALRNARHARQVKAGT